MPPTIHRSDRSPNTVAAYLNFDAPPQKKKYASGPKMIGLVPKTSFLPWLRNDNDSKGNVTDAKLDRDVRSRRESILYHFSKRGKKGTNNTTEEVNTGPVTRSSAVDDDEWIIDMEAANCDVTDTRRLSRYCLEHILTLAAGHRILLLVRVESNPKLFSKRWKVNEMQKLPNRVIGGKEYYQLRCKLDDVSQNELATIAVYRCPTLPLYNESWCHNI